MDLLEIVKEGLSQKLPKITSFIKTYLGIDPSETQIPVAPTCHCMMGGLPTDDEGYVLAGKAGIILPGLYAAGECACVSVNGANRLGCNSLIILVVFSQRSGLSILKEIKARILQSLPVQAESIVVDKINSLLESKGTERVAVLRETLQCLMTKQYSVFRNGQTLEQSLRQIRQISKQLLNIGLTNKSRVFNYELQEALELNNMLTVVCPKNIKVTGAILRTKKKIIQEQQLKVE